MTREENREKKRILKEQKAASKTAKTITQPKPEEEKPEETQEAQPVNLCDDCAYEFGECEGTPKFGEGEGADNVIECPAFVNVAVMPTAQEAAAQGTAAAEEAMKANPEIVLVCSGGCGRTTERLTDMTPLGEFKQVDESGVPEWTCQECLDRLKSPFNQAISRLDERGCALLHARADEIRAEADRRFGPDAEPTPGEMADTLVLIVQEIVERERSSQVIRADLPERPDPNRFQAEEDFGTCRSCETPLKRTAYNRYRDAVRCTNGGCRAYRTIVRTVSTGVK